MTARLSVIWLAFSVFLCGLLIAWPDLVQPQVSDVFSSSGQYDRFAVGGAHRWYDKHSTEVKEKSSHCLSLLDEAKVYQDKALALYEEARQPGNSRRQTELVKQANEQIRLRGEKLRAFTDCVNQALRQTGPPSDQFASSGDGKPSDQVQTQPTPLPGPDDDGGSKGIKRLPEKQPTPQGKSQPTATETAADDCFATSVPNYRGPDWARYNRKAPQTTPVRQIQPLFDRLGVAADQALDLDEAVYGTWQDRELMRDYLICES